MTYLADTRGSSARGSRAGRAMGAVEATSDPVAALIAQVNRFGPTAPATHRLIAAPYPVATGKVPNDVAVSAAMILHRRALDSVLQFGDTASRSLLAVASAAQKAPSTYVSTNIGAVTTEIKAFADSIGAPEAKGFDITRPFGVPLSTLAIAAGGAAALFFVLRRRK